MTLAIACTIEITAIRTNWDLVPQDVIVTVSEKQVLGIRVEDGKMKYFVRDRQIFNRQ